MAFATVGSFLASQWGPVAVQAGATGLSALYGAINPNRARELQNEVIQGYRDLRETAQRQARGEFSPQEREQIRAQAQPQLQQVAGSVASRGLGSSPAGAQIAATAEQQVFSNAQLRAQQNEHIVNRDAYQAAMSMANRDESFYEDIAGIARALQMIRQLGGTPDPKAIGGVASAFGFEDGYMFYDDPAPGFYDDANAQGGTL